MLEIQRGCVARWNSFSCLLPPETRASSARSVHRIRPPSCWQKLGEACQLSTRNAGFLLTHPLPFVSLPIVAHQSGHWDNDREVSWYTLMKCNTFLKDFCLCQNDRGSWLKIAPSKSRLIDEQQAEAWASPEKMGGILQPKCLSFLVYVQHRFFFFF